ncbi:hypothetical protein ISF_02279 [Cordyceps fumosorosea ARSEF 2679]|uniref:Uncharacterized protein n=1 Tax=Cordyceps fumosorosea (strain ARSEF 2679) TaxID=1081104 RepID=A0A168BMA7_CORFA|nr:hypothetical protein ISF_02279 [Cordyceps fumosorosea ARSEF 2679]OAA70305.1 hypothetical protein ISF_02279 [Cordyceps fumosorosea ARSEF 2679]
MSESEPQQQVAAELDAEILANTAWVTQHIERVEATWRAGAQESALSLIDEGLVRVRRWRDVRLWEMLLLRQRYRVLMMMRRREEAEEALGEADRISESLRKLSD